MFTPLRKRMLVMHWLSRNSELCTPFSETQYQPNCWILFHVI